MAARVAGDELAVWSDNYRFRWAVGAGPSSRWKEAALTLARTDRSSSLLWEVPVLREHRRSPMSFVQGPP
jgi:hypothetical protein